MRLSSENHPCVLTRREPWLKLLFYRNLKKLHEVVSCILTQNDVHDLYRRINQTFKNALRERIAIMNIINNGGPQHGFVFSFLSFLQIMRVFNCEVFKSTKILFSLFPESLLRNWYSICKIWKGLMLCQKRNWMSLLWMIYGINKTYVEHHLLHYCGLMR